MVDWSESLFNKLATDAMLLPRTREACQRVLVPHALPDGSMGVERPSAVARELGIFDSHISRAVKTLRQKLVELGDVGDDRDFRVARTALGESLVADRDLAVSNARKLYGEHLTVRDAEPGQTYIGSPLVKTPEHVVQLVPVTQGHEAVIHSLAKLQQIPNMTLPTLLIGYPAKGGLAEVQETAPGQTRGGTIQVSHGTSS